MLFLKHRLSSRCVLLLAIIILTLTVVQSYPAEEIKSAEGEKKPAENEIAPQPLTDEKPAEGDEKPADVEEKKPAEEEKKPAEEEKKPAEGEKKPAEEEKKPAEGEKKPAEEEKKPAEGENKPAEGEKKPAEPSEGVSLTMAPGATTPKNIFTNRYGEPVKDGEIMNITLANGGFMEIYTEKWLTYYTQPATKPGCMCLTRGPLPLFKLIGNIHFPKIKVTPERYVTLPTEPPTTLCPPCICHCGSTPVPEMFDK